MSGRVAFVLKGYPRLSETFIAQEILALEKRGLEIEIVSLRHASDRDRHPVHDEIAASVTRLPEYLHEEPFRTYKAWLKARRLAGYEEARRRWLADLKRDPTRNRMRRFGQACVVAAEVVPRVSHLHAHFLHTPASVARYAAIMTGLGWSASAHAKDIYTTPRWDLAAKIAECRWLVTCTAANRACLEALAPHGKVDLVYHGIDATRWPPPDVRSCRRDGSDPDDPVRLVSVGRAVEKKGYATLLGALAGLPRELHWHLTHVGDGPLLHALARQARQSGLSSRISWHGARRQDEVLEILKDSDFFVLAPVIAADGDRDGLPNVLLEAQSQALAVVSTDVSAVPELIEDGINGCLVAAGDQRALQRRLEAVIRDPILRNRMGREGEHRVRTGFSMETGADRLMTFFEAS